MSNYTIIKLNDQPQLKEAAAMWFHNKWDIPLSAYLDSIEESLVSAAPVPCWYVAMDGNLIIGGLGVIVNDFHDRKDLTPNVCAVYVEEAWRRRGIAGTLLNRVCTDMAQSGIYTLYLITNHTSFYERYGWEFYCMVQGDGEDEPSRMYVHRS